MKKKIRRNENKSQKGGTKQHRGKTTRNKEKEKGADENIKLKRRTNVKYSEKKRKRMGKADEGRRDKIEEERRKLENNRKIKIRGKNKEIK